MKYFKKLKGESLYLSPINTEDLEVYADWINTLSTTIPMGNASNNFSLLNEKEAIERLSKEGHNYAIIRKEDDTLIGNCSLFDINQLHRTAELGIFIGDENNRGQGLGGEAINVMLSYGFKVLNLHNIMLKVFSFNERAIKAYEKVGFKECGRRHEAFEVNNQLFDDVFMEILESDFNCDYLSKELPDKE